MVDKELIFLDKNKNYGVVKSHFDRKGIIGKIVYADGTPLKYGDPAEIFGVLNLEEEFFPFIESVITESQYLREHYNFVFGYQSADFENEEIRANEVRIFYAGVKNTVSKKYFFDLCLLLCNAKQKMVSKGLEENRQILIRIEIQLQNKLRELL